MAVWTDWLFPLLLVTASFGLIIILGAYTRRSAYRKYKREEQGREKRDFDFESVPDAIREELKGLLDSYRHYKPLSQVSGEGSANLGKSTKLIGTFLQCVPELFKKLEDQEAKQIAEQKYLEISRDLNATFNWNDLGRLMVFKSSPWDGSEAKIQAAFANIESANSQIIEQIRASSVSVNG